MHGLVTSHLGPYLLPASHPASRALDTFHTRLDHCALVSVFQAFETCPAAPHRGSRMWTQTPIETCRLPQTKVMSLHSAFVLFVHLAPLLSLSAKHDTSESNCPHGIPV